MSHAHRLFWFKPNVLKAGDTVEMRLGHPTIPHLWILVTDPHPESQKSVIVSVTTLRSHSDQTVILRKGDHPYILHDSVISYQDAQEFSVVKIQAKLIAAGRSAIPVPRNC